MASQTIGGAPSALQREMMHAMLSARASGLGSHTRIIAGVQAVNTHDIYNTWYEHDYAASEGANRSIHELLRHYESLSSQDVQRLRTIAMNATTTISRWLDELVIAGQAESSGTAMSTPISRSNSIVAPPNHDKYTIQRGVFERECVNCTSGHRSETTLRNHLIREHSTDLGWGSPFPTCPDRRCGVSFSDINSAAGHILAQHTNAPSHPPSGRTVRGRALSSVSTPASSPASLFGGQNNHRERAYQNSDQGLYAGGASSHLAWPYGNQGPQHQPAWNQAANQQLTYRQPINSQHGMQALMPEPFNTRNPHPLAPADAAAQIQAPDYYNHYHLYHPV